MITLENRGNKKGIRKKIGQVYRIPLEEGVYGYGQAVTEVDHAFFDYKDNGQNTNIDEVLKAPVLFKLTVDRYVIAQEYWEIIGKFPVNPEYQEYTECFSYNSFNKRYEIWRMGQGRIPATWEEIKDLECMASWGHTHVEQRLRDHFAGRPNFTVEYFKNEHNPDFERHIQKFYKQYGYDFKLPGE